MILSALYIHQASCIVAVTKMKSWSAQNSLKNCQLLVSPQPAGFLNRCLLEQRLRCSTAERPRVASPTFVAHAAATESEAAQEEEVTEEEDLRQIKDRDEWYIARFVADDAPDFNPGQFLSSAPAGPSLRVVAVEAEISREKVPLRNAYMHIGQKCSIRVNNGPIRELTVASPPFPQYWNQDPLFKARGDISAGEIKIFKDIVSIEGQVELLMSQKEADEVFNLTEGDKVEVGPFVGAGLDLRPMQSIYQYPTLIIFAEGKGIATARALIQASDDSGGLNLRFRQDIRLYYRAPNEASLLFTNEYEQWEAGCNLKVFTGTRDTFLDLFDEDDTLTYEPETTAAIILTGDDEEAEKAALEACKEAEIQVICKDSVEQIPTKYLAQIHGQV